MNQSLKSIFAGKTNCQLSNRYWQSVFQRERSEIERWINKWKIGVELEFLDWIIKNVSVLTDFQSFSYLSLFLFNFQFWFCFSFSILLYPNLFQFFNLIFFFFYSTWKQQNVPRTTWATPTVRLSAQTTSPRTSSKNKKKIQNYFKQFCSKLLSFLQFSFFVDTSRWWQGQIRGVKARVLSSR